MNRLEAIPDVRKGTGHNDRHRVVDVRSLHLFLDVNLHDPVLINGQILIHYSLFLYLC